MKQEGRCGRPWVHSPGEKMVLVARVVAGQIFRECGKYGARFCEQHRGAIVWTTGGQIERKDRGPRERGERVWTRAKDGRRGRK